MADDQGPTPVNFIDNPNAPEVHSTGHAGLWVNQGNLHITLAAGRVDHKTSPGPINNVVIARLVMPLAAAAGLADHIRQMLGNPGSPPAGPEAGSALH